MGCDVILAEYIKSSIEHLDILDDLSLYIMNQSILNKKFPYA